MSNSGQCLRSAIVGMLGLIPALAFGQDDITKQQRADYGRIFQAKATPPELSILLEAQEKRLAVPADEMKFRAFLESSPSSKALKMGLVPILGQLLRWNEVALDASALDHANTQAVIPDESFFGEQFGPPRTSRAMAIVHLAMFEAVNTISPQFESYKDLRKTIIKKADLPEADVLRASKNRAIVEAGYQTLIKLYPKKKFFFENARDVSLTAPDLMDEAAPANVVGALIGRVAAKAVLDLRYLDGSDLPDLSADDFASPDPYKWHQDPISKSPSALGGNWPRVKPFLIPSGESFRNQFPGPPAPGSAKFIQAYKDVKRLGGDPNTDDSGERAKTPTDRTGFQDPINPIPPIKTNQTFGGIFWAYDASAYLCAPPRLYNMMVTSVALKEKPIETVEQFSYYLAMVNTTLADAAIVGWDAKYYYIYPRPITLIRTLSADATPAGDRAPFWTPLGAQATNGIGDTRNITPPFPAYPSGHAVFGGSLFQVMVRFYKSIDPKFPDVGVPFQFVSDEFNGLNCPPGSTTPRKKIVAQFDSFRDAENANNNSRIYLGVHWQFDCDDGTAGGEVMGNYTFDHFVKPLPKK